MMTVAEMAQWFRKAFDETQSQMLAEATIRLHEDLVHREDFTQLTATVERLAVAQERTEVRLDELAIAQKELTAAQKQQTAAQKELTAAQKELTTAQKELTTAQKETERNLAELSQETSRLARVTDSLAHEMKDLARAMKSTRRQVGGLAQTVGYGLEAYAMDKIPQVLATSLSLVVESSKPEHFTAADGTEDEIDMVVRGTIASRPVVFLCEVKTNITPKEVADFLPVADRVRPQVGCDDVRILYFAYRASTEARRAVADVGAYLAFPHALIVTQQN